MSKRINAVKKLKIEIDPTLYQRAIFEESFFFGVSLFEVLLKEEYITPRDAYSLVIAFQEDKKHKDLIEKYITDAIEELDYSHVMKFSPFRIFLTGSYIMKLIFGFKNNDIDYAIEVGSSTESFTKKRMSEITERDIGEISFKGAFYQYSIENTLISVFNIKKSDIILVGDMKKYVENYPLDVSKSCYNLETKKLTVLNWLEIVKNSSNLASAKYKKRNEELKEKYVKRMNDCGFSVNAIGSKVYRPKKNRKNKRF